MPWLYSVTLRGISFVVMLRDKFISKSEALLQNQSATQICVVMRQQYGFSAPVLQSSFRGETRGGLGRLFLKARRKRTTKSTSAGNHRDVQPTRTNSSVFLEMALGFSFCFCTIIRALESKVPLFFDLITNPHH